MTAAEFEKLAEKVHKVYCKQYLKDNGKPYWTEGDYSKLDEKTKQYDRNIVTLMESYAQEKCREQREADGNPKGKDTFTKNYPAKGSFIVYLNHADVLNTPLVTTKTDDRPKCDECGKPLLDSELNVGTCEECLCPE